MSSYYETTLSKMLHYRTYLELGFIIGGFLGSWFNPSPFSTAFFWGIVLVVLGNGVFEILYLRHRRKNE